MSKTKEQKLVAFINRAPWHEMLFQGLKGDSGTVVIETFDPVTRTKKKQPKNFQGTKWRSFQTHIRGYVLLYNSKHKDDFWDAADECGFDAVDDDGNYSPAAEKQLREKLLVNKGKIVGIANIVHADEDGTIYLSDLMRFPEPVEFKNKGSVNWAHVPVSLVEKQLQKIGMYDEVIKYIV